MKQLCRCSPPDLLSPEYARFSQRDQASHFAQDQTNQMSTKKQFNFCPKQGDSFVIIRDTCIKKL
jgi:hypothetical protein